MQGEKIMPVEIYKDKKGEFRFRVKAKNGKIIAVSEGYKSKQSCEGGIESLCNTLYDPIYGASYVKDLTLSD